MNGSMDVSSGVSPGCVSIKRVPCRGMSAGSPPEGVPWNKSAEGG